jgi:hypothetical protein
MNKNALLRFSTTTGTRPRLQLCPVNPMLGSLTARTAGSDRVSSRIEGREQGRPDA